MIKRFAPAALLSVFTLVGCADDGAAAGGASGNSDGGEDADGKAGNDGVGGGADLGGGAPSGGGGGSVEPCTPGATESCYSGDAATLNVGSCVAGTRTCSDAGTGFGGCLGEVVPTGDSCATAADEDCDGELSVCTGNTAWSKRFGNSDAEGSSERASDIRIDAAGNLYIAGNFNELFDLGVAGMLDAGGTTDAFVMKLSPDGEPIWAHPLVSTGTAQIDELAIDDDGNVAVVGTFSKDLDAGAGVMAGENLYYKVFLVGLTSDGELRFGKVFGSSGGSHSGSGIAVDSDGRIAITGAVGSGINFGGNQLNTSGGNDVFVAIFDDQGEHLMSKRFGDASGQLGQGIGFMPDGDVVVAGYCYGTIDFGGGPLTSAGLSDAFVARLDGTTLEHVWSERYGDGLNQDGLSLATDASGNVAIATYGSSATSSTVDFGGGPVTGYFYVVKLDEDGAFGWAQGSTGLRGAGRVRFDELGSLIVVGAGEGTLDVGGGPLVSFGSSYDILIAKYDAQSGDHIWSRLVGDSNQQASLQQAHGVDADASGNLFVAGYFLGNINFGDGEIVSGQGFGGGDVFLAKLEP
jgi:hypothetical protein